MRGGYRENSGRKANWKSGKTIAVRIPESIIDDVLKYARLLDEGHAGDSAKISKIRSILDSYSQRASKTSNPRWDYCKKMILELQSVFY